MRLAVASEKGVSRERSLELSSLNLYNWSTGKIFETEPMRYLVCWLGSRPFPIFVSPAPWVQRVCPLYAREAMTDGRWVLLATEGDRSFSSAVRLDRRAVEKGGKVLGRV